MPKSSNFYLIEGQRVKILGVQRFFRIRNSNFLRPLIFGVILFVSNFPESGKKFQILERSTLVKSIFQSCKISCVKFKGVSLLQNMDNFNRILDSLFIEGSSMGTLKRIAHKLYGREDSHPL